MAPGRERKYINVANRINSDMCLSKKLFYLRKKYAYAIIVEIDRLFSL